MEDPPGTQRLESLVAHQRILAPQPTTDPNQPLNWSSARKAVHVTLLSLYAVIVFAILTTAVPAWAIWVEEFRFSYDDLNNAYASNMAALSVGCVFFVPISLRFGRRPVYILTSAVMFTTAVWQAKMKTVADLFGINVVSGLAGAVNEALFQVTVSDLYFVDQRGTMNGLYFAMVLIGNYFGPVAAGYVVVNQDWRWIFWYCSIFMGTITLLMVFFLEESKYPAFLLVGTVLGEADTMPQNSTRDDSPQRASRPIKQGDDAGKVVRMEDMPLTESPTVGLGQPTDFGRFTHVDRSIAMNPWTKRLALWTRDRTSAPENGFWLHVYQPFQLLYTFPAVMFAALQYGFSIGMLAVLATTQAALYPYEPYNFSAVGVGNMNIPPAVGGILGSIFGGAVVDWFIVRVAKRRDSIYEPETRLYLFVCPGLAMPIGTMMYGLTIAKGMHWSVNAIGAGLIGFGLGGCGDIAVTYLQDSYTEIIGDALVSVIFVRNIISCALVFAIGPWMAAVGTYYMFVTLGCISVACSLSCVPLLLWGRTWRKNFATQYIRYSKRQYC